MKFHALTIYGFCNPVEATVTFTTDQGNVEVKVDGSLLTKQIIPLIQAAVQEALAKMVIEARDAFPIYLEHKPEPVQDTYLDEPLPMPETPPYIQASETI